MDRIEDEASLWAARLRGGGMTEADREQLETWLARDPEHRTVLARYRELTAVLDVQLGVAPPAATASRRWWRAAGAATVLAAAAAVVFGFFVARAETFTTRTAERRVVALADGSRVELNARTELSVALSRRERHVQLVRGEALFIVAKDAARPFVVATPSGVIQVTGTVFDVRTHDDAPVEVTVLEGHVQVRPLSAPASGAVLDPDRQALLSAQQVTVHPLSGNATQDVVAWRQGQVVFEDTPLREALSHFDAYDARRIDVDAGAAELRIGGRYSLDDLNGALESIERVLPVRVIRETDAVRVVRTNAAGR